MQDRDYEFGTNRLIGSTVVAEAPDGTAVNVQRAAYSWDNAGNLKSVLDAPAANLGGRPHDRQCYRYDGLRRLTQAWTPAGAQCATDPATANLGGAAPYWHSYSHDTVGNRTQVVEHSLPNGTAAQTQTFTRPASGPNSVRPHAVTSVSATGRGAGTSSYTWDAAGNMTGRNVAGEANQQLAWDVEGELAELRQDGNGDGDTSDANERDSYISTADGERVLRTQDGTTTLYLGYQELTLNHASGAISGERYYSFAGQAIATRTGHFAAEVTTIIGDHHNTGSVQIPNVAGPANRVHRYTDPYGKPRGPHGGTGADGGADGNWTGEHGYLDKPVDSTGLTAIGARMYDPVLGAFISVDPIMDLADPQQWNAYAYSNNNPTTFTDPTGKRYEECGTTHNCQTNSKGNVTSAKKYEKRKPTIWDIRSRVVSNWSAYRFSGYRNWSSPQDTVDFSYRATGTGLGSLGPLPSKAEIRKAEALRQIAYSRSLQSSAEANLRSQLAFERRLEQRDDGALQFNGGACAVVCVDVAAGNDDDHGRYFNVAGGYGWEFGISGGGSYAEGVAPGVSHGVSLTVPSPIGVGVNGTLTFDEDLSVSGYSTGAAITARAGGHMFVGYTFTER